MSSDKPPDDERSPLSDLYEDSQLKIDPALKDRLRKAAPEVSQGAWRERAFTPRQTMAPEEISAGLKSALKNALLASPSGIGDYPADEARRDVKHAWLPFVQQAVEQAGGDGLDVLLRATMGKKGGPSQPRTPLLPELLRGYAAMNAAETVDAFLNEAGKVQSTIERALSEPNPAPLSFKALEKDLEGRLDQDQVLAIFFATDAELSLRLEEVKASLDNLREQLRTSMGDQPNALLWNFSRLKAERVLLEGEQRRRARGASPGV